MTPAPKKNKEFAKWVEEWVAGIRHSHVSVGQIRPEKSDSTNEQNNSEGADTIAPVS